MLQNECFHLFLRVGHCLVKLIDYLAELCFFHSFFPFLSFSFFFRGGGDFHFVSSIPVSHVFFSTRDLDNNWKMKLTFCFCAGPR